MTIGHPFPQEMKPHGRTILSVSEPPSYIASRAAVRAKESALRPLRSWLSYCGWSWRRRSACEPWFEAEQSYGFPIFAARGTLVGQSVTVSVLSSARQFPLSARVRFVRDAFQRRLGLSAGRNRLESAGIVVYVAACGGSWRCDPLDVDATTNGLCSSCWAAGALCGLWNAQSDALKSRGFLLLGAAAPGAARRLENTTEPTPGGAGGWRVLLAVPVCLKLTPLAPILLLSLWPLGGWGRLAGAVHPFLPTVPNSSAVRRAGALPRVDRPFAGDGEWPMARLPRRLDDLGGAASLARRCVGRCRWEPMDSACYRLVQLATAAAALGWCLWQRRRHAA